MSDIVTRLQIKAGVMEMGERIAWGSDTSLMREAADTIETLKEELGSYKAHCAHLELKVSGYTSFTKALAESQAREKVLRDALKAMVDSASGMNCGLRIADEALAMPTDDSALRSAIQHGIAEFLDRTGQYVTNDASRNAALAAERERCVKECDWYNDKLASRIRALGD